MKRPRLYPTLLIAAVFALAGTALRAEETNTLKFSDPSKAGQQMTEAEFTELLPRVFKQFDPAGRSLYPKAMADLLKDANKVEGSGLISGERVKKTAEKKAEVEAVAAIDNTKIGNLGPDFVRFARELFGPEADQRRLSVDCVCADARHSGRFSADWRGGDDWRVHHVLEARGGHVVGH